MRKRWIAIFTVVIIGGLILLEVWFSSQFPSIEYEPGSLSPLVIGVEHKYDYFKEGELVGYYVFWVEALGIYKGKNAYFTRSRTSVEDSGTSIEINTLYIFDEHLAPLEYGLNASLGDDRQSIICLFDGWSVNASLELTDRTIEKALELPEHTVLVDNFMPGHWEFFFRSFPPVAGKRVKFNVYIPQFLGYKSMALMTDKETETLNLNGVDYECQVVRTLELDLVLYINDGNLIQMEETKQKIVISITG